MKITGTKYLFTLLITIAITNILTAQTFKVNDVNKTRNSNPSNYQFAQKNMFAVLKGVFYFTADDGIHGNELFASDGTARGTKLVKDILPGSASSNVLNIIVAGNKLYFSAADTLNKSKVWVSDGTDAGTKPLANLAPSFTNSYVLFITDVNGSAYFNYNYYDNNYTNHNELWKTDSAGSGAVRLANFNGFIEQMVNVNGRLFFAYNDYNSGSGTELYTSDGTPEGTKLVTNINTAAGSNPIHLTAVNGLLYFAADDGTGNKLWVSNGSGAGTYAVINNQNIKLPLDGGFGSDPFAVKKNTLFFQGYIAGSNGVNSTGFELCKYNTANGSSVRVVRDIKIGVKSSRPINITNVKGTLFFITTPDSSDAELWKTDGTRKGTVMVKNINPGGHNSYSGLTNFHGTLLFSYGNDTTGSELWKSDGTPAGTVLVKNIFPGSTSSSPWYFTDKDSIALFSANSPKGVELWRTDGTDTGTFLVKDINPRTTSSSSPFGFTQLKNKKVIFSAYDGKNAGNLFVTDGTGAGTKLLDSVATVNRLINSTEHFAIFKDEAYFTNFTGDLFKTNGTKAGTKRLAIQDVLNNQSGYISNLVATEEWLYIFTYNFQNSKISLWRTDGTASGTIALKNDISGFYQLFPTAVGNTLYFASYEDFIGGELWKTNGSVAGTTLVKAVGGFNYNPLGNLYSFKGKLYFNAFTPSGPFGAVLWTSDGTEEGTVIFKDLPLVQQSFAEARGKLFFYALDPFYGYELFATDGTTGGTYMVKDINEVSGSSNVYLYPSSLISGDTLLYFIANDGIHGSELWKSDGTRNGTKQLRDITPDIYSSNFNYAVNIHDNLYFTVNDELWQSDGTKANTHVVNDENLNGISQINNLAAIGDNLYFSAYTYAMGDEVYSGNARIKPPTVILALTDSIQTYIAPATIAFNAAATDNDGSIDKVEFYNGTSLLHTERKYPYDFLWKDVPVGNYTIIAKATDNSRNIATSNPVNVTVTAAQPPANKIATAINNTPPAITEGVSANLPVLRLSPDPAAGFLLISATGLHSNRPSSISIIAANGVVLRTTRSKITGNPLQLDVSMLSSGMYTVRIISGGKSVYKQFIKL